LNLESFANCWGKNIYFATEATNKKLLCHWSKIVGRQKRKKILAIEAKLLRQVRNYFATEAKLLGQIRKNFAAEAKLWWSKFHTIHTAIYKTWFFFVVFLLFFPSWRLTPWFV
jgi:hypothetical protein